jgi:RNA polymerase sigma-70 factor (ECF subfamily)
MGQQAYESGTFPVLRLDDVDGVLGAASASQPELEREREAALERASDDAALLDGLLVNDPRAWREFGVRYERLIQRCISKVTRRFGSRVTPDDVREIHTQLVLSLLANDKHKLRSFDPERGNRFSSWIGMLAMNAAYDYLRSIRREPNKTALSEAIDLPADVSDPFEQAAERERAGLAARMLSDFSERDRTFAALYFGEGMDPVQIAERMNISIKTVYSKKHKIQTKLESLASVAAA